MGSLSGYGAVAGAAGEYLDQSREARKNDFTLLRDKRLSELKQGDQTQAAGLVTDENKRQEIFGKTNYSVDMGETKVVDGRIVHQGTHRPNADSSTKKEGNLIEMINGDLQTEEQIRKTYQDLYEANTDEYGNRIGDFDLKPYDDWRNTRVAAKHQINPKGPEAEAPAEASTASLKQATDEANEMNKGFTPFTTDKDIFSGYTQDEWIQKRAKEIQATGGSTLGSTRKKERVGMLSEDTSTTAPPAKPKSLKLQKPLSQASKTDPTQMYDELRSQGFDEPDIIDTIREYFKDPTWEIPPNSLM